MPPPVAALLIAFGGVVARDDDAGTGLGPPACVDTVEMAELAEEGRK